MNDYYRVLNVPRDASDRAIRDAYVGLIKRHHPDVARDGVGLRVGMLGEAYACLRDPERRALHDAALADVARRRRPPRARRTRMAGLRGAPKGARVAIAIAAAAASALGGAYLTLGDQRSAIRSDLNADSAPMPDSAASIVQIALFDHGRLTAEHGPAVMIGQVRRCFEDNTLAPSPNLLDYCVALDSAAAISDQDIRARPFFTEAARRERALAQAGADRAALGLRWAVVDSTVRRMLQRSQQVRVAPAAELWPKNSPHRITGSGRPQE